MVVGLGVNLDHGILAAEGVGNNLYGLGFRGQAFSRRNTDPRYFRISSSGSHDLVFSK